MSRTSRGPSQNFVDQKFDATSVSEDEGDGTGGNRKETEEKGAPGKEGRLLERYGMERRKKKDRIV